MRRLFPFAALGLAACATAPQTVPTPGPVIQPGPAPRPEAGTLIGLTQVELVGRFGTPSFQVREGTGLKLQWQNAGCVLDAYLYPPERGAGQPTTVHVDTRRPMSGEDVPQPGCLTSLSTLRP